MTELTARHSEALETIRRLTRERGYPPTVREFAAELGIKSTSSAFELLNQLRELGVVVWEKGQVRTLRVIE